MAEAATDPRDMWALYPWRHPATAWRAVFGAEMDTLVQQGVLRRVRLEAVAHPDFAEAGSVLRVEQMSEWEFHGVSEASEVPSRSLTATDVEGLELAPEMLRQYLGSTLGVFGYRVGARKSAKWCAASCAGADTWSMARGSGRGGGSKAPRREQEPRDKRIEELQRAER